MSIRTAFTGLMKGSSPPVKAAFISTGGAILTAVITGSLAIFSSLSSPSAPPSVATPPAAPSLAIATLENQATDELISILQLRASRILEAMELAEQEALAAVRAGKGNASAKEGGEAEFVQRLEATRKLFIELHEKHIQAIKEGQFTVAHELVSEIHHLLWIRNDDIFWGSQAVPERSYAVYFELPIEEYPGPRPEQLAEESSEEAAAIWPEGGGAKSTEPDTAILDRIEARLEQMQ